MDGTLPLVQAVPVTTPDRWITMTQSIPAPLQRHQSVTGECRRWNASYISLIQGNRFSPCESSVSSKVGTSRPSIQTTRAQKWTPLPRTARHQELGPVTLEQLLHEWAAHDLMHTVQAERALMRPFIEGCGPWRPYFADHIAAKA